MIIYVANSRYGSPTRTPHQKSQRIQHQPNQIWPTDLLKQETSPYKYSDSRQKPNGTPIIRSPKTPKHPILGPLCACQTCLLLSRMGESKSCILQSHHDFRFTRSRQQSLHSLVNGSLCIEGGGTLQDRPHTGASYDAYNQHQSPHLQSWANFFQLTGAMRRFCCFVGYSICPRRLPLVSQGARLRARFFFI